MRKAVRLSDAAISGLEGLCGAPVLIDEPMSRHTTYRIGGPADYMVAPANRVAFAACLRWAVSTGVEHLVVGAGSNLLVSDRGIRGLVISTSGLRQSKVSSGVLSVEAGALMPAVAASLADAGWCGFEEACGIPGTIGGGLCMNAGAYGWNISDVTERVIAVSRTGEEIELDAKSMAFGAKTSALMKDGMTALLLEARVRASGTAEIRERMSSLLKDRASKQPLDIPNAGCVFRNPSGTGAGRLIDAAGLKGMRIGGAVVSTKHANFIVNVAGAASEDVRALMEKVRAEVYDRFGERLEPEIRLVGDWDDQ